MITISLCTIQLSFRGQREWTEILKFDSLVMFEEGEFRDLWVDQEVFIIY